MRVIAAVRGTGWPNRAWRAVAAAAIVVGVSAGAIEMSANATTRTRVVVKVVSTSKYGKILETTKGYALYTYASDSRNHSACNGSCLSAWPALTVPKGVRPIGRGVKGISYFVRSNGKHQVTFKGKPLYRFTSDTKPNEVSGQGVAGFSVATLAKATSTTTTTSGGYGGY
jgi:predicted lipoprotein with Yx(FWY)xxD motif